MKAKLFMILLFVLFIVPRSEAATEKKKRHAKINKVLYKEQANTRIPINYNIDVNDNESCLQIIFQFYLQNAEIQVTDKNGNTVTNESQTIIYEGKTVYIYIPKAYPYTLEIISPTVEIIGEIVLEEY